MTPEDKKLWDALKGTVKPLKQDQKVPPKQPADPSSNTSQAKNMSSDPSEKSSKATIHTMLDKPLVRKLRKGTLHIEGRLDLHGMTQVQAILALNRFIHHARLDHKKLVLIITGKGVLPSFTSSSDDVPRGVLRQMLPQWIKAGDVGGIRSLSPSLPEHGGNGAFYALLSP